MTTTTINPERLADLEAGKITLHRDAHLTFEDGHCAMEVVAWLAELGHTDAPSCSSRVLGTYTIRLNDQWNTEQRQKLAPYLPRLVGTANDGQDEARSYLALDWLIRTFTPAWLDLAGFTERATALRNLDPITDPDTARAAAKHVYAAQTEAKAAGAAAWDAASDAAGAAARFAVRDAAGAAAWDAASDAAGFAASDAARAAAAAAAGFAASDAARFAASDAAAAAARTAAWITEGDAEGDAAKDALAPTVETLQASALDLLDRMIDPSEAAQ